MKSFLALTVQVLLLCAIADASFVRRRPHQGFVHRRNLLGSGGGIFDDFDHGMSSMWNDLTGHGHSASSSSSSSRSPTTTESSSSSSTVSSSTSSPSSTASRSPSQSADSANTHRVAETNQDQSGSALNRWLNGILGGNQHQSNGQQSYFLTNPDDGRVLAGKPKLGLAWPNGDGMNISHFLNRKVSWYYSWDATPGMSSPPDNVTFCPMLWGDKKLNKFKKHVLEDMNNKNNAGKCVLGMNEVNQRGQADMSVDRACNLLRENVMPLKDNGFYFVSPVTTNAPDGMKWMKDFRNKCSDVWSKTDAVAVHFYGTNATEFKQYVTDWHETFNKPVWVTEYACQNFNGGQQCTDNEVFHFHMEMSVWFDQQDFVEAYAPFGVMDNLQDVNRANSMVAASQRPNWMFQLVSGLP